MTATPARPRREHVCPTCDNCRVMTDLLAERDALARQLARVTGMLIAAFDDSRITASAIEVTLAADGPTSGDECMGGVRPNAHLAADIDDVNVPRGDQYGERGPTDTEPPTSGADSQK